MTLGNILFILGVMPFTIIGLVVVSSKIGNLFTNRDKDIDNHE